MPGNSNVPAIRFAGFTDPWEQRKLGDVTEVTSGQSPNGANYTDNPADHILVQGNADLKNHWVVPRVWTTEVTKTATPDDLIFSVRAPVGEIGRTAFPVVIGRGVASIRGGDYLYAYLEHLGESGYWSSVSAGSTFDAIGGDELRATAIWLPNNGEQRKIGAFFQQLDNLITLHQRKHDKLTTLKKSMLEKMFPKEGADIPEIRFAGFTDPWEQRKLKDVAETYSGGTPSIGNSEFYEGDIPFIRSAEIGGLKTELSLSNQGLSNSSARMVDVGDVLYALYGATSGEVAISNIKGAINQAILAILPNVGIDNMYLANWLRREKQNIIGTYLQGGQGNLSGAIVKDLDIPVPCSDEQVRIGALFASLDNLITLHQRQLDSLKKVKRSCLDKMFV